MNEQPKSNDLTLTRESIGKILPALSVQNANKLLAKFTLMPEDERKAESERCRKAEQERIEAFHVSLEERKIEDAIYWLERHRQRLSK
jgi:hypothetical protein